MKASSLLGFAVGPVGTAALGFVTVPLIAWIFTSEDVGRLNILQMSCSLAMIVFTLGLDQAYIREYYVVQSKALLLKQMAFPILVILLIATALAILFRESLTSLLFKCDDYFVFLGMVLAVWGTLLLRIFSTVLRMQEQGWRFSLTQLLNKAVLLMLCVSAFLLLDKISFAFLALAFAAAVTASATLAFWFTRKEVLVSVVSPMFTSGFPELLRYGLPLVISGFFYWGLTASGTFALSEFSTLSELGIYSVALSFGAAATIFQQVFTVIWAPTVYKWLAEEVDPALIEAVQSNVLSVAAFLLCLVGIFSEVIEWFLPDEYAKVKFYVLCTLVPPLFYTLSEVSAIGISVSRKTWLNMLVSALAFFVNVVLCVYWVPLYGAAGAVIANTLAYAAFLIVRTEVAVLVWRRAPRSRLYIMTILMSFGACGTVFAGERGSDYVFVAWIAAFFLMLKVFSSEYCALFERISTLYRSRRNGCID